MEYGPKGYCGINTHTHSRKIISLRKPNSRKCKRNSSLTFHWPQVLNLVVVRNFLGSILYSLYNSEGTISNYICFCKQKQSLNSKGWIFYWSQLNIKDFPINMKDIKEPTSQGRELNLHQNGHWCRVLYKIKLLRFLFRRGQKILNFIASYRVYYPIFKKLWIFKWPISGSVSFFPISL